MRRPGLQRLHKEPVFVHGRLPLPAQRTPAVGWGSPVPGLWLFSSAWPPSAGYFLTFSSRSQRLETRGSSSIQRFTHLDPVAPASPPSALPVTHQRMGRLPGTLPGHSGYVQAHVHMCTHVFSSATFSVHRPATFYCGENTYHEISPLNKFFTGVFIIGAVLHSTAVSRT